ncbi:T9SS type A sorting domain-containing protein [Fulvivirga sp. M361]|uniref:putative Ig domain-containing protein n=1 Tax=Fulvivirga sp. M361 TaxID=2594266 RepID=UPI00117A5071|nr:putative Ig domain-containing protein [Fulvivirga sp. M361]TRX48573.1 T9SS type A sorting domain-containing protein [Fulvivirga sp. M361]
MKFFLCAGLCFLHFFALSQTRYFVDADASGSNDGSSWENAFLNLSDALTVIAEGDEIWMAEGTYLPGNSRFSSYNIRVSDLKIYGGFNGTETDLTERDITANPTILSGEIGGSAASDNIHRIIFFGLSSGTLEINGLTIRDAYNISRGASSNGGGIVSSGRLKLENMTFLNNRAPYGGAVYVGGSIEVVNSRFEGNMASGSSETGGGAIVISSGRDGGKVSFVNTEFINNGCTTGNGGAIAIGGSVFSVFEEVILDQVMLEGNYVRKTSYGERGNGGGIHLVCDCKVVISNTTISSNEAQGTGGGMYCFPQDSLQIINTTISGNYAEEASGGLITIGGNVTTLDHVTIVDNSSKGGVGGWLNSEGSRTQSAVKTQVINSIIAANNSEETDFHDIFEEVEEGKITSLGYNIIGNIGNQPFDSNTIGDIYGDPNGISEANEGADRVTTGAVDPLIEALADNGGFTLTHALREDSPARNGGTPSDLLNDQRGLPYVGRPDIGAFEFNAAPSLENDMADQLAIRHREFSFTIPGTTFNSGDEGDILSFTATAVGDAVLPSWLTFDPQNTRFTGTPLNEDETITVKVTALDQRSEEITDEFKIIVIDEPIVGNTIPDQAAFQLQAFSFTIPENTFSYSDEVADKVSYTATQSDGSALPAWLTFDEDTRQFSGAPAANDQSISVKVTATYQEGFSISDEFDITMNVITSLHEQHGVKPFFYPNPVGNVMHIRFPESTGNEIQLIISSINGKAFVHHTFVNDPGELSLSMNELAQGVYILEFHTEVDNYQYKIIKQ